MKQAIRIVVLIVGLFTTLAAVAAPFKDGVPRPKGTFTAASVHQPAQDGVPRPKGT